MVDFKLRKRSHSTKRKLMLWIDIELIDKIEEMKPPEITVQEAMRQILEDSVTEYEALRGL